MPGTRSSGRRNKPTAELQLHGTFREDGHGDRRLEPQPTGEPELQPGLGRDGQWFWRRYVPGLIAMRVATAADEPALWAMCRWWQAYKREDRRTKGRDVYRIAKAWTECAKLMSKFGLTPVDRTYIRVEKAKGVREGKGRFFAG